MIRLKNRPQGDGWFHETAPPKIWSIYLYSKIWTASRSLLYKCVFQDMKCPPKTDFEAVEGFVKLPFLKMDQHTYM